ncbi:MAG TPA: MFS transporter [Mycobacteriales bacterium]|nr:MFS transporter [Mycobacteriales bacterium]
MTNDVRTLPPEESLPDRHPRYDLRWWILAVVLAAECMDLIDSTVVNVAAPQIARDFHASTTSLQWIVGGYPLAIAVGLIIGGRLGDLVGRKTMFILGSIGFVGASVLCGLAPNSGVLIFARLVQGAFSAMMLPQGFGIIREVFPEQERQSAFAVFGPVIGFSAVLGPIIGASLIKWNLFGTGWRMVFLINVPLGAAAIAGAIRLLPASIRNSDTKVDWVGTALVTAFSILLVYPLIQGREYGWPWWTFAMMATSVVLIVTFAWHQRRRDRNGLAPLVTPSVFGHRGFSAGMVFLMLFFGGFSGVLLCSTLFLQIGQSFTPIHAALCTVPMTVGLVIGSAASGGFLGPRYGRRILQAGVALSGLGWVLLVLALRDAGTIGFVDLMPGLFVAGLGFGLIVAPLFDIVLASVTDEETGSASGVLNAGQQLAASIGVAVLGTVFFDAIGPGNFHHALSQVLAVQVAVMVVLLVISPLLPRFAREPAA